MTVSAALRDGAAALVAAGLHETPRLDVELLMARALGVSRSELLLRHMGSDVPDGFASLLERRLNHEPVAYILGEQEFFGLGKGVADLLMVPWNLAMQGWAYFNVPSRQAPPGSLPYFDGLRRGGLSASFLGLVPLALFFMFERWFLVPLPKGPLEAWLGY